MLQARPKGTNDPFYAPHRDVAYLFPHLCVAAMRGLDAGNWEPWYKGILNTAGLTEEDLAGGAKVLADFTNGATDTPDEQIPQHTLERIGWFKLPKEVQYTVLAKVGQMTLSAYFMAIREVTHLGEAPPLDMDAIVRQAEQTAHYLSMPRWYRWLARAKNTTKLWLGRKLLGKRPEEIKLPKGPMPLAHQGLSPESLLGNDLVEAQPLPAVLPKPGISPYDRT